MLATAAITSSDSDPEPDLPDCYRDREYVEGLIRGISGAGPMGEPDPPDRVRRGFDYLGCRGRVARKSRNCWCGPTWQRRAASEQFGPMVAAAAHRRNFMNALHRAFVGDGSAWIWKLHKQYFPTFEAIVDFLHVLGHLFAAAKAAATGAEARWELFQGWAEACWKGQVHQVIEQLRCFTGQPGAVAGWRS